MGHEEECQGRGEEHWALIPRKVGPAHLVRNPVPIQIRSTGYGSLSIWTHNFRGITTIDTFKPTSCPINGTLSAVRVAAGHTGYEVQLELSKLNRVIVTGANPGVGLMGWIMNGGHGMLSSTYGMGADNLLEATIVTPDGREILTNPCINSDLFFAIRGGGGGTYGVVLSAVIKTFPSPRTTLHQLSIASVSSNISSNISPNISTEYYDLLGFLHAEMPRLKEGGMQGYYRMTGPPATPTLSFIWGFFIYDKPNGTVEKLMGPIKKYLDDRKDKFVYQQESMTTENYWDIWGVAFTSGAVANGGGAYGSRLLSEKSLEDPKKSARVFEHIGPSVLGKNVSPLFRYHAPSHILTTYRC
jgi:FAD/FMN-containing dehydrogenase